LSGCRIDPAAAAGKVNQNGGSGVVEKVDSREPCELREQENYGKSQ
jgi:hypothetical protein